MMSKSLSGHIGRAVRVNDASLSTLSVATVAVPEFYLNPQILEF